MRVLAGRIESVFSRRPIELADRGARLHRVGDEPVVCEVELDDPRRFGERGLDRGEITQMPIIAKIAGCFAVDLRRTWLKRRGRFDRRGLLDKIDLYQLGGIAGLRECLGDDDGDLVADMADPVGNEWRMRRLDHRRAVLRVDLPAARQPADPVRGHVLSGIDGYDTRGRGGRGRIDAGDPRIGVRAAQDVGVELSRPIYIVGVSALAGQEAVILTPPDRRSDDAHRPYSAATPWALGGGASPRMTAAPSIIASTMLW